MLVNSSVKDLLICIQERRRIIARKWQCLVFTPQTKDNLLTCMVFISVHAKTSKCKEIQLFKRVRFNLPLRKKSSGIFRTALTMWEKIHWKLFCLLHFSSYPLYHNYSRNLQGFLPQMENSSFHTKYLIVIAIQLPKVRWFGLGVSGWLVSVGFFKNFIIRVQGSWFFRFFVYIFWLFFPITII